MRTTQMPFRMSVGLETGWQEILQSSRTRFDALISKELEKRAFERRDIPLVMSPREAAV
jgi:hypothetical protein